jgi:hypothetical protein
MSKEKSLKIVGMDKKEKVNKKIKNLNPLLPRPPFRWSLAGASFSGKSTMICNLFRKEFYGKFWKKDHIFVFSPTAHLDDKLKECIPSNNFYDKFDSSILQEIYDQQDAVKKTFGKNRLDHILIILDDMLGSDAFQNNSIITKFIHKTRHYRVSYIYSVQKYTGLSRTIRLNSDVISIFRCTNFGEIDGILEEQVDKKARNKMRELLIEVFSIPFEFLHIDYQKPLKDRYSIGFDKPIPNPSMM